MDEQAIYALDQKINDRGVRVDRALCEATLKCVEREKKRLNAEMKAVTRGFVTACSKVGDLTDYLHMNGIEANVAKADVVELLARDDLAPPVRQALLLRQEAAKSSTAKIDKMLSAAGPGDRVRGMFQYHGASTGRWAGRLIQLHNLPRPTISQAEIEECIPLVMEGRVDLIDLLYARPMDAFASLLRAMLVPDEGNEFICVDFSAIEGRGLAWSANEDRKLTIYRGDGRIYEATAADIYGVEMDEVTKEQRFVGKVGELALGYGGGKGAFVTMAKNFGVVVSEDEAEEIKIAWRAAAPKTVQLWSDLEDAAKFAETNRNRTFDAGPYAYRKQGSWLMTRLPSGRLLYYPYPKIEERSVPWGGTRPTLTYMGVNQKTRKWERLKTYGGKLAENVTQAICRDLLAEAMLRLEARGYKIVMHVHDEIVCEVKAGQGSVEEVAAIMSEVPAWAAGMPIAAEGWRGTRYRK